MASHTEVSNCGGASLPTDLPLGHPTAVSTAPTHGARSVNLSFILSVMDSMATSYLHTKLARSNVEFQ